MKPRRALLFTITIVLALCAACGVWLHKERQQYARNRQLIDALERNDTRQALALVNAGADPNTRFDPPPTPSFQLLLNQLLHHKSPPINESPTAFLLACGMDGTVSEGGTWLRTLLPDDPRLVQAMLAHGADLHTQTADHHTCLEGAISYNHLRVTALLLDNGADVNERNTERRTPLMWAVWESSPDMVDLLLARGAAVNAQDENGDTPLHEYVAAYAGGNILPHLLAHGADLNLRNKGGRTPLMLAQQLERARTADQLRRAGKDAPRTANHR